MKEEEATVELFHEQMFKTSILKVLATDPHGIRAIKIWSKWGRIPMCRKFEGEKSIELDISPYPATWFPVVVDVENCVYGLPLRRFGPFNLDGSESTWSMENTSPEMPPGTLHKL